MENDIRRYWMGQDVIIGVNMIKILLSVYTKMPCIWQMCIFRETCISFLKLYFYYFLLFVYGRECTYVCRCPWRPEASDLPEAGVIYRCELSALGAGK